MKEQNTLTLWLQCDSWENIGQTPTSPTYSIFLSTSEHVYENPTTGSLPQFCEKLGTMNIHHPAWGEDIEKVMHIFVHIHAYTICYFSFCKTLKKGERLFIVSVIYNNKNKNRVSFYLVACYSFFFFSNRCYLHSRKPSGFLPSSSSFWNTQKAQIFV